MCLRRQQVMVSHPSGALLESLPTHGCGGVVVVVVKKEVGLAEDKVWRKEDLRVVWQRRGVMNMETAGW